MSTHEDKKRAYDALQADIREAKKIINAALQGYIQKKIKARTKKEAENMDLQFAELDDYSSPTDIQDAYGWGTISDSERSRLLNLWEVRDNVRVSGKKYSDRITDMIELTIRRIGDEYQDDLGDFEQLEYQLKKEQA